MAEVNPQDIGELLAKANRVENLSRVPKEDNTHINLNAGHTTELIGFGIITNPSSLFVFPDPRPGSTGVRASASKDTFRSHMDINDLINNPLIVSNTVVTYSTEDKAHTTPMNNSVPAQDLLFRVLSEEIYTRSTPLINLENVLESLEQGDQILNIEKQLQGIEDKVNALYYATLAAQVALARVNGPESKKREIARESVEEYGSGDLESKIKEAKELADKIRARSSVQ